MAKQFKTYNLFIRVTVPAQISKENVEKVLKKTISHQRLWDAYVTIEDEVDDPNEITTDQRQSLLPEDEFNMNI